MKIKISDIVIKDARQREELGDIEGLAESMKAIGQITPIALNKDNVLQAGERRIRAAQLLGWEEISVHYMDTKGDPVVEERIELEENIKRKNLTWQEECDAISRIHALCQQQEPEWTEEKTASLLNVTRPHINNMLNVDRALKAGDPAVVNAKKISEVNTVLKRRRARQLEELTNDIFNDKPTVAVPEKPILCADFCEWIKTYEGAKFDFIHCDFPYGVGLQDSGQVAGAYTKYDDQEDVYWTLLHTLCDNIDKVANPVSHLMFWFSMDFYESTKTILENAGFRVFPFPLYWMKSDQKGIVPDQFRQPRRITETAFMASRGDRKIRTVKNNAVAMPTEANRFHVSTKPKPVLEYFFQMFVDDATSVFDPTCGSGNALIVAKDMGAKSVFGIERDQEFVDNIQWK